MNTHKALQWRYATQKFDTSKTVSQEEIDYILQAGNLAASSFGVQPYSFVQVDDPELKKQLVEVSYGQEKVAENSTLIVVAARTDVDEFMIDEYISRIASTRNMDVADLSGFKDAMVSSLVENKTPEERLLWAQKQSYIALGTMMVAAAEQGIDGGPMEGFQPDKVDEVLNLGEYHLHATTMLALGHRSESDETQHWAKVRKDLGDIVVHK